jgi:hypothetical protein
MQCNFSLLRRNYRVQGRPGHDIMVTAPVRCGQDVLKAVALGAKGTCIGSAFLRGLGAIGLLTPTATAHAARPPAASPPRA